MRNKKQDEIKEARKEIERDIDIVQAPLARQKLGTVIKAPKASVKSITKKQLRERAMAARSMATDDNDNDDDDSGNSS